MAQKNPKPQGILRERQLKFIMAWRGDAVAAARAAGYRKPEIVGCRLLQNPAIETEIRRKQRIMTEESAKHIAAQLVFDRNNVLNHLWELSQIPPEKTNNTLSSQVKAAETLTAVFDAEFKHIAEILPHLHGRSPAEIQFWIRNGRFPDPAEESQMKGLL